MEFRRDGDNSFRIKKETEITYSQYKEQNYYIRSTSSSLQSKSDLAVSSNLNETADENKSFQDDILPKSSNISSESQNQKEVIIDEISNIPSESNQLSIQSDEENELNTYNSANYTIEKNVISKEISEIKEISTSEIAGTTNSKFPGTEHNMIKVCNQKYFKEIDLVSLDPDHYIASIGIFMKGAQEPWPKDVKLFQPLEMEQILLPDNANCLAVQAFLKMCNLPYEVEPRTNAEFMSPSKKVPFIKCGAFLVAELDGIVHFVSKKNISLTSALNEIQRADLRAFISLVRNVLENAELYICWCDPETFNEVTKLRYGSVYPWPLNIVQTRTKKQQIIDHLKVMKWLEKSLEEVYQEVEKCCESLSIILQKNDGPYFFGNQPCELDALLYGHVLSILKTPLPSSRLIKIIRKHKCLIDHCEKIHIHIMGKVYMYEDCPKSPDSPGAKSSCSTSSVGSEVNDADFDKALLTEYQII